MRNGIKNNTDAGTRRTTPGALFTLPRLVVVVVVVVVAATAVGWETVVTWSEVNPAELSWVLMEAFKVFGVIFVIVLATVATTFAML